MPLDNGLTLRLAAAGDTRDWREDVGFALFNGVSDAEITLGGDGMRFGLQKKLNGKDCSDTNSAVNSNFSTHFLNHFFAYAQSKPCTLSIYLRVFIELSKFHKQLV